MSRSLPGDGFTKRARAGTLRGMSEATQSTTPRRTWSRRTVALAAVAALILALIGIGLAVVAARRSVSIEQNGVAPAGEARGNVPVRVRFSREMDRASAEARFRIAPDVPGEFTWSDDRTLVFTPQRALPAGQTYTVTIDSRRGGASGATLDRPFTWQFAVLPPRVCISGARQRNPPAACPGRSGDGRGGASYVPMRACSITPSVKQPA